MTHLAIAMASAFISLAIFFRSSFLLCRTVNVLNRLDLFSRQGKTAINKVFAGLATCLKWLALTLFPSLPLARFLFHFRDCTLRSSTFSHWPTRRIIEEINRKAIKHGSSAAKS